MYDEKVLLQIRTIGNWFAIGNIGKRLEYFHPLVMKDLFYK